MAWNEQPFCGLIRSALCKISTKDCKSTTQAFNSTIVRCKRRPVMQLRHSRAPRRKKRRLWRIWAPSVALLLLWLLSSLQPRQVLVITICRRIQVEFQNFKFSELLKLVHTSVTKDFHKSAYRPDQEWSYPLSQQLMVGSWLFCIQDLPCFVSFDACFEAVWRFEWRTS